MYEQLALFNNGLIMRGNISIAKLLRTKLTRTMNRFTIESNSQSLRTFTQLIGSYLFTVFATHWSVRVSFLKNFWDFLLCVLNEKKNFLKEFSTNLCSFCLKDSQLRWIYSEYLNPALTISEGQPFLSDSVVASKIRDIVLSFSKFLLFFVFSIFGWVSQKFER